MPLVFALSVAALLARSRGSLGRRTAIGGRRQQSWGQLRAVQSVPLDHDHRLPCHRTPLDEYDVYAPLAGVALCSKDQNILERGVMPRQLACERPAEFAEVATHLLEVQYVSQGGF